jgi:hypothetical protein
MVVATLAEVAQEMGAPISAYVDVCLYFSLNKHAILSHLNAYSYLNHLQKIMPLALKELASSDATNRRNAAFCVGELCKNGGAAALRYMYITYSNRHISCSPLQKLLPSC